MLSKELCRSASLRSPMLFTNYSPLLWELNAFLTRMTFPELVNVPGIFLKPDLSIPCVQEGREWNPRETGSAKGTSNGTQAGERLTGCLASLGRLQAAGGRCHTVHPCFTALCPPYHGKPGCLQPSTPPYAVRLRHVDPERYCSFSQISTQLPCPPGTVLSSKPKAIWTHCLPCLVFHCVPSGIWPR